MTRVDTDSRTAAKLAKLVEKRARDEWGVPLAKLSNDVQRQLLVESYQMMGPETATTNAQNPVWNGSNQPPYGDPGGRGEGDGGHSSNGYDAAGTGVEYSSGYDPAYQDAPINRSYDNDGSDELEEDDSDGEVALSAAVVDRAASLARSDYAKPIDQLDATQVRQVYAKAAKQLGYGRRTSQQGRSNPTANSWVKTSEHLHTIARRLADRTYGCSLSDLTRAEVLDVYSRANRLVDRHSGR